MFKVYLLAKMWVESNLVYFLLFFNIFKKSSMGKQKGRVVKIQSDGEKSAVAYFSISF